MGAWMQTSQSLPTAPLELSRVGGLHVEAGEASRSYVFLSNHAVFT